MGRGPNKFYGARGATQVRLALNKNPACDARRGCREASLTQLGYGLVGYRLIPFALITVAVPDQATCPSVFVTFALRL